MNTVKILNSFIEGIHVDGSGGLFAVDSKSIFIHCCFFHSLSATKYGGCGYAESSNIELKNSFFLKCRIILTKTDRFYGNALYVTKGDSLSKIDCVSHSYCGIDPDDGDSSIVFNSLRFEITNMNSSLNYGFQGSSIFSAFYPLDQSTLKFSQDANSGAKVSIESQGSVFYCILSNFINTTNLQYSIVWTLYDYELNFSNCVFYQSHEVFSNHKCTIENCYSDAQFSSVSTTFSSIQSFIHIEKIKCNNIMKNNSHILSKTFHFVPYFVFFCLLKEN